MALKEHGLRTSDSSCDGTLDVQHPFYVRSRYRNPSKRKYGSILSKTHRLDWRPTHPGSNSSPSSSASTTFSPDLKSSASSPESGSDSGTSLASHMSSLQLSPESDSPPSFYSSGYTRQLRSESGLRRAPVMFPSLSLSRDSAYVIRGQSASFPGPSCHEALPKCLSSGRYEFSESRKSEPIFLPYESMQKQAENEYFESVWGPDGTGSFAAAVAPLAIAAAAVTDPLDTAFSAPGKDTRIQNASNGTQVDDGSLLALAFQEAMERAAVGTTAGSRMGKLGTAGACSTRKGEIGGPFCSRDEEDMCGAAQLDARNSPLDLDYDSDYFERSSCDSTIYDSDYDSDIGRRESSGCERGEGHGVALFATLAGPHPPAPDDASVPLQGKHRHCSQHGSGTPMLPADANAPSPASTSGSLPSPSPPCPRGCAPTSLRETAKGRTSVACAVSLPYGPTYEHQSVAAEWGAVKKRLRATTEKLEALQRKYALQGEKAAAAAAVTGG